MGGVLPLSVRNRSLCEFAKIYDFWFWYIISIGIGSGRVGRAIARGGVQGDSRGVATIETEEAIASSLFLTVASRPRQRPIR